MANIDINSLKSNSLTYKNSLDNKKDEKNEQEKEKIKPVIDKTKIASTKKPFGRKIMECFLPEDVKDIKTWFIKDILIPSTKDFIFDGISMIFYGEKSYGSSKKYGRYDYSSKYDYSRRYRDNDKKRRRDNDDYYTSEDNYDFRNIVIRQRQDAEMIIDEMIERIRKTGSVSIAEMFDLLDIPSRYTDNNYGWDDERDIGLKRVNAGFLIKVTEPKYLD